MDITLNRADLAEAAAWVSLAISKAPDSPTLAGMQVIAADGAVWLAGSDVTTAHRATLAAEVTDPGETLVSGRFLVQIVAALKANIVRLELAEGFLVVSAGRSTYRMRTMNPADYPKLPEFPKHVGTIAGDTLADVLGRVDHAVSRNPNLAALTAVNLVGDAGHLTATATDRFRMAQATAPWADSSGSQFEANIPGATLLGAVKGFSGPVEVGCAGTGFGLRDKTRSVVTRVLGEENKFPRVAPIFERAYVTHVQTEVSPLVEALKRARLVGVTDDLVSVTFSDGLIQVAGDGSTADGSEEVDCTGFGEGEMLLKFNGEHLTQALNACPDDVVSIGLIAPGKQISVGGVSDDSVQLVVMARAAL